MEVRENDVQWVLWRHIVGVVENSNQWVLQRITISGCCRE